MKTLVLCPLKIELEGFLKAAKDLGYSSETIKHPEKRIAHLADLQLIAAVGGHGKVQMALSTQRLLLDFPKIPLVICLGTAGALSNDVKCLDVVVGEKTVEHDYISQFGENFSRPAFLGHFEEHMLSSLENTSFKIHFGTIASGDEDILSPERAQQIRDLTSGGKAVAWEGAGAARACKLMHKEYCEIRGISDTPFGESGEAFVRNLPVAMSNATQVLLHLIKDC